MPQIFAKVNQSLPTPISDGIESQPRLERYGGLVCSPIGDGANGVAAEGSYFKTATTINTPVAYSVSAAFSATTAFLVARNTDSTNGKSLYLDYIRLLMTTIPASATAWHLAITTEPSNRYTSGGTTLTPANANTAYAGGSIASVIVGVPVISAAVSPRTVLRSQVFAAIPVVGSELIIDFGNLSMTAAQTKTGTLALNLAVASGPVVLGPGSNHSMLMHLWFPANATTPAQFECEMGWWER